MSGQAFEYLSIRCAVDNGTDTASFWEEHSPDSAYQAACVWSVENGGGKPFWSIYGHRADGAVCIGDFLTFDSAYDVLVALCMPMRNAINLLEQQNRSEVGRTPLNPAVSLMEDFCNQSSNEERL